MKDIVILERIIKGDEEALDYLYKKNYKMMLRLVLNNNGTEDEAKDIYQEALIAFWQKAISGNLVLTSKISTYLYSICLNLWRKELDKKSRFSESDKEEVTFQDYENNERIKIIHDCINELGDSCRKILTYHYFDGLSMTDIAEKLNFANTDTAKTKKYKCKKKLDTLVKSKFSINDVLD
jgi:RNA polymerase sigma factor (sigma-70 family)